MIYIFLKNECIIIFIIVRLYHYFITVKQSIISITTVTFIELWLNGGRRSFIITAICVQISTLLLTRSMKGSKLLTFIKLHL